MTFRDDSKSICNVTLTSSNWMQASLPITFGGIGIRRAALLAPSAFLASATGCSSMFLAILPGRLHVSLNPLHSEALQMWKSLSPTPLEPPIEANTCHQKHWDLPLVESCFSSLISAADSSGRIRLLASQQKVSRCMALCAPCLTPRTEDVQRQHLGSRWITLGSFSMHTSPLFTVQVTCRHLWCTRPFLLHEQG